MSVSLASVGAITLFVDDPARSRAFYEQAFGLTAIFEDERSAAFKFENVLNLALETCCPRLIEPATVASPARGRASSSTIWVAYVVAAMRGAARRAAWI